jgi:hypothetical protein
MVIRVTEEESSLRADVPLQNAPWNCRNLATM